MTAAAQARFLGIADSAIGKLDGVTHLDLVAQTAAAAVRDAELDVADVDGLICVKPQIGSHARHAASVAEYLGLSERLRVCRTVDDGGASPLMGVVTAFGLVESGVCEAVLVVAADTPRTGQPAQQTLQQFAAMRHPVWEQPVGISTLAAYALVADAYLNRHGLDEDALALVPVEMRRFAMTNPRARFRSPLTASDVLDSPVVSSPLRQLECCALSDGGAALLIGRRSMSPARARGRLLGWGEGTRYDALAFAADLNRNGVALSMQRALDAAGCAPSELDMAFLYDSYSIAVALQLEALGVCGPGRAPAYLADEGIGASSRLPVNPHGGLLSHGHCGSAAGMHHLTEMVRQMRGEASNQLTDAGSAIVHGEGGVLSMNCTAVFRED